VAQGKFCAVTSQKRHSLCTTLPKHFHFKYAPLSLYSIRCNELSIIAKMEPRWLSQYSDYSTRGAFLFDTASRSALGPN